MTKEPLPGMRRGVAAAGRHCTTSKLADSRCNGMTGCYHYLRTSGTTPHVCTREGEAMGLEHSARRKLYAISFTIAVLTAALLTAGHARASATFSADSIGVFQGGGLDSDVASGAAPVTVSSLVANINGTIHSTSETGRGYMKLFGDVSAIGSKGTSGTFGGMFVEFRDL